MGAMTRVAALRSLARTDAVRDAWTAFWLSRFVVVAGGLGAVLAWGVRDDNAVAFDPEGLTRPFGGGWDDLLAPFARWDAVWFLEIADDGYLESEPNRTAFFPLYPLLVRAGGFVVGSDLAAGILISLACLFAALVLLHRLVALDFGRDAARLTVLLVAVFPGAVWFSAVYSEALYLLLSVAAVWLARTDRWMLAGCAGGLAAMSRSAGVVLLVPLFFLWWRSPRRRLGDLAWTALVPAGVLVFSLALAAAGQSFFAPFDAQEAWSRTFAGPFGALVDAWEAGRDGARALLDGAPAPDGAFDVRKLNVWLLGVLVATLAALAVAVAVRRLPAGYWLYVLAALALPLSYPVEGHPLMSLPRFVSVLWPLHLGLALWLLRRPPAVRSAVLAVSLLGLAAVSGEVASWGWVA